MIRRLVRLFVFEWRKLIARRLALVAILLVAIIAVLAPIAGRAVSVAESLSSGKGTSSNADPMTETSWYAFTTGLQSGLPFIVLVVLILAGSSISEEAQLGTLKVLFTRPIRRLELVLSKWFAIASFGVLLVLVMTVAALLGGMKRGSYGDLVNPTYTSYVIKQQGEMISYTVRALLLVLPGLFALVGFGLLVSSAIDHAGYAVGTSMALALFLAGVGSLAEKVGRLLFVNHVRVSLDELNGIALGINEASKHLREVTWPSVIVSTANALVFIAATMLLVQKREVGD